MANLKRRNPYDGNFLEDPDAESGPASSDDGHRPGGRARPAKRR